MYSPNFYQIPAVPPSIDQVRRDLADMQENLKAKKDELFDLNNGGGQQYGDYLEQYNHRVYLISAISNLEQQIRQSTTQLEQLTTASAESRALIEQVQQRLEELRIEANDCVTELCSLSNGGGQQYGDIQEQARYRGYLLEKRAHLAEEIRDLEEQSEWLSSASPSAHTTPGSLP